MADTYMPSKNASKSRKAQIRRNAMSKKRSRRVPNALSLIKQSVGNLKGVGVPETLMAKLSYQYTPVAITSGVAPFASINWSVNNCVDIDPAIGGVQPPLFDNFMAIYKRFRVVKCKFAFDYASGSGYHQRIYVKYMGEDTTDLSSDSTYNLFASGNVKTRLAGPTATSKGSGSISQTYDLKRLVGSELDDGFYYGGPATAPATILTCQVGVQALAAGATSCYLTVQPRMELWVEFNDLTSEAVDND